MFVLRRGKLRKNSLGGPGTRVPPSQGTAELVDEGREGKDDVGDTERRTGVSLGTTQDLSTFSSGFPFMDASNSSAVAG